MTLEQLTIRYGEKTLVENASVKISTNCLTALIGRNGTGKSTLLRVLAGTNKPTSGIVTIEGRNLHSAPQSWLARHIAVVTTGRIRISNMKCIDVVGMGRAPYTDWIGRLSAHDKEVVARSMASVGMSDYADRAIDTLSDGEFQRIMIARSLAQQTPAILLDEPTSFLDLPSRYEICRLLHELAHNEGKLVLFSTHELDIALKLCDDIMLIDTPNLICKTASEMSESDILARIFSSHPISNSTCQNKT